MVYYQKSNFMILGNRTKLRTSGTAESLKIENGKSLLRVKEFTYLGLKIDDEMNMNAAANDVIKRVNHKIYTLSVLRKDMLIYCAIRLYKAMILPLNTPDPSVFKTTIKRRIYSYSQAPP